MRNKEGSERGKENKMIVRDGEEKRGERSWEEGGRSERIVIRINYYSPLDFISRYYSAEQPV